VGRFADLCGEVASEADEGPDGLILPSETLARLREAGWADEDINDALEFVQLTFIQNELVDAADSLSAKLVEILGVYAEEQAFNHAAAGRARLSIEVIGQLARRVAHLERVIGPLRESTPVDRSPIDRLERRLADRGIEEAMGREPPAKRRPEH
jgi:hypothetical protein